MLYVCIPTHNEAVTVGVLLWRLRTMFREQAAGRDYEVVVYDDASTDATPDVLAPYARVLPLELLRGERRVGQSAAVERLVRHVVERSRAPECDAVVLMQADYTDAPERLPELLARFDAGADLVLTRRPHAADQPLAERRLRRAAPLLLPPLVRPAVRDTTARDPAALLNGLRLFRVAVLRDALLTAGHAPLLTARGWAGTAELVVRTAPFARRIERIDAPACYDVRTRPSRIDWVRELRAVATMLWQNRAAGRRPSQGTAVGAVVEAPVRPPGERGEGPEHVGVHGVAVHEPELGGTHDDDVGAGPTDATGNPSGARRRPSRRRRSRGRSGAVSVAPDAALDVETEAATVAPETAAPDAALPDAAAPDDNASDAAASHGPSDAAADVEPAPKRRRRRGGARRRARGSGDQTGVPPEDADADPATWHGAPPDQPPS
ncbi:hypothetical protein tb265_33440 [Gemmatimonadetes bacterium T265]|nr:hypothetical protein tb265_33440 [Gemmatimonadetes bacterium T265]